MEVNVCILIQISLKIALRPFEKKQQFPNENIWILIELLLNSSMSAVIHNMILCLIGKNPLPKFTMIQMFKYTCITRPKIPNNKKINSQQFCHRDSFTDSN